MKDLFKNAENDNNWKRKFKHQLKYGWFYDIVFEVKLMFLILKGML